MKKKNPRRSGKNVSDGRTGSQKDEWAVKRRMGNQIARLIDEGLFNLLSCNGIRLISTENIECAVMEDLIGHL